MTLKKSFFKEFDAKADIRALFEDFMSKYGDHPSIEMPFYTFLRPRLRTAEKFTELFASLGLGAETLNQVDYCLSRHQHIFTGQLFNPSRTTRTHYSYNQVSYSMLGPSASHAYSRSRLA